MIKNRQKLEEFEKQLQAQNQLKYLENLQIFKALHKKAVALNAFNNDDIMRGIEKNIRLAKALNSLEQKWNN